MISADDAENAVHELINSADRLAWLEGQVRNAELKQELAYAKSYIAAKGANIEERKANAKLDPKYEEAYEAVTPHIIEYKKLLYRRKGLDDLCGLYRTQESSRRQGM